jgi:enoyl-[acyl-carrier protein] reductase I
MEQKTPREHTMAEAKTGLMAGKRGLVMGVANDHSIAWGIAQMLARHGAEIAFTYQGDAQKKRLAPLAQSIGSSFVLPGDVESDEQLDAAFAVLKKEWGTLDFLVHAIAFSDREELKGRYVDTSRANFAKSLDISCYSFTAVAQRAAALMPHGGSLVTLTYLGAQRVMPNYNVMGVAKAALEASVRYAARDLGPKGIRVNAISAGALRTLSLAGISGGRAMVARGRELSAMKEDTSMEGVAGCALWLLSDLGRSTTGEVVHVDAGFHMMGLPSEEEGAAAAG